MDKIKRAQLLGCTPFSTMKKITFVIHLHKHTPLKDV